MDIISRVSASLSSERSKKDKEEQQDQDKQNLSQHRWSMTKKFGSSLHKSFSLRPNNNNNNTGTTFSNVEEQFKSDEKEQQSNTLSNVSLLLQIGLLLNLLVSTVLVSIDLEHDGYKNAMYRGIPLGAATVGSFFCLLTSISDFQRKRFGSFQRFFYILATLFPFTNWFIVVQDNTHSTTTNPTVIDGVTLATFILQIIIALVEVKVSRNIEDQQKKEVDPTKKAHLNKRAILRILKPYFWPASTASSATINRIRAILTWVFVASSKACSLTAPIFLGKASTDLSRFQYTDCAKNAIFYALLQFSSSAFKEGQGLIYLKVAQTAFVELSEVSFSHLHSLSLDWHLQKKLGEVIRSMDRGIQACDMLMKYAFLWLLPAIAECILVCIIFITVFDYLPLAATIFIFVFVYIFWTIFVTLFRKKIRSKVTKSDNDWHDKCTDSLVNFETVKYFTAEKFEIERFGNAVRKYQSGNVNVQASLSFLNITQQMLMQSCLAAALSLAAFGIKQKIDCCVNAGCENGNSQCCSDLGDTCPGMEIGDFVTVLSYTLNLFMPLNFLGSVYNMIVMSIVDLRHLSELLAETADVTDAPDAIELPKVNAQDPDIAVEFDNVVFHYPSQPDTKGLKGLSFKMKRGTTTAVVGPTGAGKTTVSRLFFRFYDVLGGAVKVNGIDVRSLSQKSLRSSIGVVPQTTSLFNDSVKYNVSYGKLDATDEELEKAAKGAQLWNFIQSLPEGWETVVGDRGLKLSGGEKQRTAIARCLMKDPPFVILDEATSALDTVTENSVQDALDSLGSDRTCLVIAHRLGTIRNADNIVVIDEGVVVEQGTHDELLVKGGKYAELWDMQLHSTSSSNLAGMDISK